MKPARFASGFLLWPILFQAAMISPVSWIDSAEGASAFSSPAGAFATMDRLTGSPRIGLDLGYTRINLTGTRGVRMEIYGHGVTYNREGWYFAVPISKVFVEAGENIWGVGNAEIGSFISLSQGPWSGVVRFGLTLPTASDDPEGFVANTLTAFTRLTDLSSIVPETAWIRFSVSPVYHSGRFISQADLGIDFPFFTPDYIDLDPWFRFNLGMGAKLGPAAFLGELVILGTTGIVTDPSDRFLETLAATVRVQAGGVEPGLSYVVPLNGNARDLNPWVLLFSVRTPI